MRRSICACFFILLGALAFLGCNDDNKPVYTASLTGAAEVPPKETTATGSATFDFDGAATVHFVVQVQAITHVTEATIASGAAGENGPVRVTLLSRTRTGPIDGMLVEGTFTSSQVKGIGFDALLGEMQSGRAYVSVITVDDPAGAIRGQIQQM
jgi:CHRD domain